LTVHSSRGQEGVQDRDRPQWVQVCGRVMWKEFPQEESTRLPHQVLSHDPRHGCHYDTHANTSRATQAQEDHQHM